MKKCTNNSCDQNIMYGRYSERCPFCGERLAEIQSSELFENSEEDFLQIPSINQEDTTYYESLVGNRFVCHGTVTEIDHHEVFFSKIHKIVNSVFGGEPYQLAHQNIEYVIRIQRISDLYTGDMKDFDLYGNYMGKIQIGDEVTVKGKISNGKLIVRSVFNHSTGGNVHPRIVFSAIFIRIMMLLMMALIILGVIMVKKVVGLISVGELSLIVFTTMIVVFIWLKRKTRRHIFGRH